MSNDFGRYLVLIGNDAKDTSLPRKLERIKADLGSLIAPVMGGEGYLAFGVVTDFTADEIVEKIWGADKRLKVSVFEVGTEFSLGTSPMGQKFYEIMSQRPAWKSRRNHDWD